MEDQAIDNFHWPEEERVFSAGKVAELMGTKRRKVMLWVEQGLIEPSEPATGRGFVRRFNTLDLLRISIIMRLEELGVVPRKMRNLLETFDFAVNHDLALSREDGKKPESGKSGQQLILDFLKNPPLSFDSIIFSRVKGDPEGAIRARFDNLSDVPPERYVILLAINFGLIVEDVFERVERLADA
ncbi:MAG: MerR family transcriptional regulator [Gemmatimonadetes bacterium]|jgi:DNA-binding transcriptional MerR regulator|nr:MerR family transcriptional regulator [Gemmatimonadota bacterium]